VWDWPPLVVNEASHGLNARELKMPRPPRIVSIVGPKVLLWFHPSGTNDEVASRSPYTLGI
jgi:hypothetical protein